MFFIHDQYYSQANTLVRDYTGSESNESDCGFCKELYNEDETWLQCSSCNIWFHQECFGKFQLALKICDLNSDLNDSLLLSYMFDIAIYIFPFLR